MLIYSKTVNPIKIILPNRESGAPRQGHVAKPQGAVVKSIAFADSTQHTSFRSRRLTCSMVTISLFIVKKAKLITVRTSKILTKEMLGISLAGIE